MYSSIIYDFAKKVRDNSKSYSEIPLRTIYNQAVTHVWSGFCKMFSELTKE